MSGFNRLHARLRQSATEVKARWQDSAPLSRLSHKAGEVARAGIDLIFPPHDFSRPQPVPGEFEPRAALQSPGLEAVRWADIRFLEDRGCRMCARPFVGGLAMGEDALCAFCEDAPLPFARSRSACLYDENSRGVILAFKHGDRLDLTPMLTRWLERVGGPLLEEADLLIPVPLHPLRLFERRFNQAAELTRPLGQRLNREIMCDGLIRTRFTRPQSAGAETRKANVSKAFALTRTGMMRVRGRRCLLIDDVFTTGATLSACTKVLMAAGARRVDTLTLARAVPADTV